MDDGDEISVECETRTLSTDELSRLEKQNSRIVDSFKADSLEKNALKHWDLFYKRNETRFFKDRHWTTREFAELIGHTEERRTLLEIGCGVGNLIYPLVEEGMNFYYYACDLSPRAVALFKEHPCYNSEYMHAFQADVTTNELSDHIEENSIDVVTLVFVLSAIHPDKFNTVLENIKKILKPGGMVLLRDYGLYDMAQLRFKPGHKIAENFYMRQDGTRSYYFALQFLEDLLMKAGFNIVANSYIHRRTVNKKEGVDLGRIFIQSKFSKPNQSAG